MQNPLMTFLRGMVNSYTKSYTITEQQLEDYLSEQLNYTQEVTLLPLLHASWRVANVNVKIGQQQNKVTVHFHTKLNLQTLIRPFEAELLFGVEARPIYDQKEHAVYLSEIDIVTFKTLPSQWGELMQPLTQQVSQSLSLYLSQQPVCQLELTGWKKDLLDQCNSDLLIEPGVLKFMVKL